MTAYLRPWCSRCGLLHRSDGARQTVVSIGLTDLEILLQERARSHAPALGTATCDPRLMTVSAHPQRARVQQNRVAVVAAGIANTSDTSVPGAGATERDDLPSRSGEKGAESPTELPRGRLALTRAPPRELRRVRATGRSAYSRHENAATRAIAMPSTIATALRSATALVMLPAVAPSATATNPANPTSVRLRTSVPRPTPRAQVSEATAVWSPPEQAIERSQHRRQSAMRPRQPPPTSRWPPAPEHLQSATADRRRATGPLTLLTPKRDRPPCPFTVSELLIADAEHGHESQASQTNATINLRPSPFATLAWAPRKTVEFKTFRPCHPSSGSTPTRPGAGGFRFERKDCDEVGLLQHHSESSWSSPRLFCRERRHACRRSGPRAPRVTAR